VLVSILIPCYNAERWIAHCIESALAQTWLDKEVIVVDDGSSDGSLKIIQSFGDRIRWETGANSGGNVARNRLLELARGEWLQYLDADDYLLSEKILEQMTSLKQNKETDVVYSPILVQFDGAPPVANPHPINTEDMWIALVRWHTPQLGGFLFRRQAILDAGGWNPAQPCCQDNELTMRLLMHGKRFFFFPGAGSVYRVWSQKTVSTRDPALVRERRLAILQECEEFLRQRQQLCESRRWAINQARFEIARASWPLERNISIGILQIIRQSQPRFRPGPAVPNGYRACYSLLGFQITERLAAWRRWLRLQHTSIPK
jgi:glycosyltransferase involved in cell wall biosynthesis